MKRNCPSCRKKELDWKLFAFHQLMMCGACSQTFKYSMNMRLANLLNLMLLPLVNYLFFGNMLILIPVIMVQFVLVILLTQYLPVNPAELTESSVLPPTDVKIVKTNDVTENIRRYKEAQRKAVKKNLTSASN